MTRYRWTIFYIAFVVSLIFVLQILIGYKVLG